MSGRVSGAMVSRATKDTPAGNDDEPARALGVAAAASVGKKGPAEATASNAAAKSFLYGFMQCAVFFVGLKVARREVGSNTFPTIYFIIRKVCAILPQALFKAASAMPHKEN